MATTETEALGIHQSDIIIRSAIIKAIMELRANPWLLDYVFASLRYDSLTSNDYGEREIQAAKRWFLSTDIPVFMNTRIDEAKCPCISIALAESSESENTLADVHYQPSEDVDSSWPILIGPFTPVSYSASTGKMQVPQSIADALVIAPGMLVLDKTGTAYEISEVIDRSSFYIPKGKVADFAGAVIKGTKPSFIASLESATFKENYVIGCHAQGEAVFLTYLHSVVVFALLMYRQSLLEARGFERSTLTSTDFRRNESFENELVFSRYVSISGYVRSYWPKTIARKITGTSTTPIVIEGQNVPAEAGDLEDVSWLGDLDSIGTKIS